MVTLAAVRKGPCRISEFTSRSARRFFGRTTEKRIRSFARFEIDEQLDDDSAEYSRFIALRQAEIDKAAAEEAVEELNATFRAAYGELCRKMRAMQAALPEGVQAHIEFDRYDDYWFIKDW